MCEDVRLVENCTINTKDLIISHNAERKAILRMMSWKNLFGLVVSTGLINKNVY